VIQFRFPANTDGQMDRFCQSTCMTEPVRGAHVMACNGCGGADLLRLQLIKPFAEVSRVRLEQLLHHASYGALRVAGPPR